VPRKISLEEKTKWLDEYENGTSEAKIATKYKHHLRIIRNGINEARRARNIKIAQIEILTGALKQHQNLLLGSLQGIRTEIAIPDYGYHPVDWHDCIHPKERFHLKVKELSSKTFSLRKDKKTKEPLSPRDYLGQHLRDDETHVWSKLALWEDAYSDYKQQRAYLQLKICEALKEHFDIPVISEKDTSSPPLVYGYTTGDLIIKAAVDNKSENSLFDFDVKNVTFDVLRGNVTYNRNILVETKDEHYPVREYLMETLNEVKASKELFNVLETTPKLEKSIRAVTPIIDSILFASYISGRCDACRRLGL
jgi:hypothetical protein